MGNFGLLLDRAHAELIEAQQHGRSAEGATSVGAYQRLKDGGHNSKKHSLGERDDESE